MKRNNANLEFLDGSWRVDIGPIKAKPKLDQRVVRAVQREHYRFALKRFVRKVRESLPQLPQRRAA